MTDKCPTCRGAKKVAWFDHMHRTYFVPCPHCTDKPAPVSSVDVLVKMVATWGERTEHYQFAQRVIDRIRALAAERDKLKNDVLALQKMHTDEMALSAKYADENERLRELVANADTAPQKCDCGRRLRLFCPACAALEGKDE